jgi:hypothetical protein
VKKKESEEVERQEKLDTQRWERERQKQQKEEIENKAYIPKRDEKPAKKNNTNGSSALKGLVTQVPQHKDLRYFDFNPYSPRNNIYYVS